MKEEIPLSPNSITDSCRDVKTPALEDNLDLIRKIAWKFARQHGLDFDDLFQEACLACVRAYPRYNPERATFSTFLWHTATNALRDLLYKHTNFETRHLFTDDFSLQEDTVAVALDEEFVAEEHFAEVWAELSPEAQEICHMVIHERDLYLHSVSGRFRRVAYLPTDKPHRCRAVIKQVLVQRGWKPSKVQDVFRELKVALYDFT
jgi:RNA polymerase sigma factor (sigma-70 family)